MRMRLEQKTENLDTQYGEYIGSNACASVSSLTWKAVGDKYGAIIKRVIVSEIV